MTIDTEKSYTATIQTSKGDVVIDLFPKEAPLSVNNFVFLAREGFYNNVKFHRIIKGFMIQGGDPTGTGAGGPGYQFSDEEVTRDYVRGTLAMANAGPNTNGSQFFIMHADMGLPPSYNIFGLVKEGIETIDAIADVPTVGPEKSTPTEDVLITGVDISES
ncbi:MAG: peptidylprolyl isomerase [SAR202 cluster bacterium]|nr:peptidylprolyl isomerase [SAR202 cluster bacterium]